MVGPKGGEMDERRGTGSMWLGFQVLSSKAPPQTGVVPNPDPQLTPIPSPDLSP